MTLTRVGDRAIGETVIGAQEQSHLDRTVRKGGLPPLITNQAPGSQQRGQTTLPYCSPQVSPFFPCELTGGPFFVTPVRRSPFGPSRFRPITLFAYSRSRLLLLTLDRTVLYSAPIEWLEERKKQEQ